MRIGIIGGGAAGLSAAHFLKQKGYRQVTVLERAGYIGGKCESMCYQGRSIDLGGDFITAEYKTVYSLAKELGMRLRHVPRRHSVDMATGGYESTLRSVSKGVNPLHMMLGTLRYAWCIIKYRRLARPGYDDLDPDTMQPFGDWLDNNGLGGLLAFETVENVVAYSHTLVQRHFA